MYLGTISFPSTTEVTNGLENSTASALNKYQSICAHAHTHTTVDLKIIAFI